MKKAEVNRVKAGRGKKQVVSRDMDEEMADEDDSHVVAKVKKGKNA